MSTTQLNDSHFNISATCSVIQQDDSGASLSIIVIIILLSNFVVGVPANAWVVWLIGTRELLASEIYLLNLAVCELLYCLGLPAQLYCVYSFELVSPGFVSLLSVHWLLVWIGRPMFQSCICMQHYIAVVHPLIFIRFKTLKVTVVQCALVWCAFSFAVFHVLIVPEDKINQATLTWFVPTLCMLLYCCFSVLFSLKRPGPGEREGEQRKRGDKKKGKAFNIILIHLVCFLVNYLPVLIVQVLRRQMYFSNIALDLTTSLGVVCGLIQPLLYLHKAGKLPCLKRALT